MFVTAFYAVLDPATRTLTYATAGHNPPRLLRGQEIIPLDKHAAVPLGIETGQTYDQATISLKTGDLLLLYTDGITEAMAPLNGQTTRQLFGVERLDDVLRRSGKSTPAQCIDQIKAELAAFCQNAPPKDDQTLIAIRCL
jgi:sigma-B regulation protein RsbU (phosphoserine phosphatase)